MKGFFRVSKGACGKRFCNYWFFLLLEFVIVACKVDHKQANVQKTQQNTLQFNFQVTEYHNYLTRNSIYQAINEMRERGMLTE